jgi:hypothetical protein
MRAAAAILLLFALSSPALAAEKFFVSSISADERLCPAEDCPSTNKVYRGQQVDVFEVNNGWARVSKFYDSAVERDEFPQITDAKVARWISAELLSGSKPQPVPTPAFDSRLMDARIQGMPDIGDGGLTEADIAKIREKAAELLESGQCQEIDMGDKSISGRGYYVHCADEPRNRFFN